MFLFLFLVKSEITFNKGKCLNMKVMNSDNILHGIHILCEKWASSQI